jgi:hypothetical protein
MNENTLLIAQIIIYQNTSHYNTLYFINYKNLPEGTIFDYILAPHDFAET